MDAILDDLEAIAQRCERAARKFDEEPLDSMLANLDEAVSEVSKAWSQSWLGYQSTVYLDGFRQALGGECFDCEWGEMQAFGNRTNGPWVYCTYEDVEKEILGRAGVHDLIPLTAASRITKKAFEKSYSQTLPLLDALVSTLGHVGKLPSPPAN